MRDELEKKLCKKYPKIFAQRDLPMNQTCMCWGFSCSDGWYDLIDALCHAIQNHIDSRMNFNKHAKKQKSTVYPIDQLEAVQVKEKYGGLRFYEQGGDEYTSGLIAMAEYLSYYICEECGSTKDVTQTKGWIRTLCKQCLYKTKISKFFYRLTHPSWLWKLKYTIRQMFTKED